MAERITLTHLHARVEDLHRALVVTGVLPETATVHAVTSGAGWTLTVTGGKLPWWCPPMLGSSMRGAYDRASHLFDLVWARTDALDEVARLSPAELETWRVLVADGMWPQAAMTAAKALAS